MTVHDSEKVTCIFIPFSVNIFPDLFSNPLLQICHCRKKNYSINGGGLYRYSLVSNVVIQVTLILQTQNKISIELNQ